MTRVLIVEDHQLFADVIRASLLDLGLDVPEPVSKGADVLEAVVREQPDLVLLDIGLPDQSGLSVGRAVLEQHPETKVVALTALDDPRALQEALRAGFHGYLTKDISVPTFIRSIQSVLDGQVVVPRRIAKAASGGVEGDEDAALLWRQLTRRERQVLGLLVEGLSGKEIASALSVSPHTVRTHVQSILMKLQVHTRLEAVAFAIRLGIAQTLRQEVRGAGSDVA